MKTNTIARLSTIAKMFAKENPSAFNELCNRSEPMLKNVSLVPQIHVKMRALYPELDRTDESILFAATVYYAYAPATMTDSSLERLPNGIRKEMCKAMIWKDAPVCNYYAGIAKAYFKGKTFRTKVDEVLSYFQSWSLKADHTELL